MKKVYVTEITQFINMWFIFLALIGVGSVSAMTDAEAKEAFTKFLMGCVQDNPIEMSDLMKLQRLMAPDKPEVKCLLACTYKKIGTLNENGMFDLEKSYKVAEQTKAGDEQAIANGKKLADVCIKVNNENVSDGNKGCDRSLLMFKCVVENAPKFGFTV